MSEKPSSTKCISGIASRAAWVPTKRISSGSKAPWTWPRTASGGRLRLRDALRHLVRWSATSGRGFRVDELPGLFREATNIDTRDVWERWLAR